jgi:hypothetical protein
MAEPDDDGLAREVRRLLRPELAERDLPDGAQEQLWQSISGAIGLGAPGGPGGPGGQGGPGGPGGQGDQSTPPAPTGAPPLPAPTTAGTLGSLARAIVQGGRLTSGLLGLTVGLAVGAGGHAWLGRSSPPLPLSEGVSVAPLPVASPSASAVAEADTRVPRTAGSATPVEPTADARAAALPAHAPASSTVAASASARGTVRDEQLNAERSLIDVARTAVGRGQGATAIDALQRHASEFPRGRLTEEREGLWIQALLLSGQRDQARQRLASFRRMAPHSMMLPALETALGVPRAAELPELSTPAPTSSAEEMQRP